MKKKVTGNFELEKDGYQVVFKELGVWIVAIINVIWLFRFKIISVILRHFNLLFEYLQ